MFTVTDTALDKLANALDQIPDPKPPNACFRIQPQNDGRLGLVIGAPAPDDAEYEHNGTTVLVLSDEMKEHCEGRTLDADASGQLVLS